MKFNPLLLSLFFFCLFTLPSPDTSAGATYKKYNDDNIQLEYPSTWSVTQKDNFTTFKNKKGTEIFFVQVVTASFDEAAEEAGFVRIENQWRLLGRHDMEGEAEEISSSYWRGLTGEAPVGVSGDFGFGLGFATVVMISDRRIAAILSGEAMGDEDGDKILKSVRFKKK